MAENKLAQVMQRYSRRRILVLDDFAEFRLSVKKMLEQFGAKQIDLAANAEDAYQLIKQQHYDIILSDFNLGDGMDGQQLLDLLKQENCIRDDMVYVIVSAENTPEMVMGAIENRPDDYMIKPLTKAILKSRLDRIIERKESLAPLHSAIHKRDFKLALAALAEIAKTDKRQVANANRLLIDAALKQGHFDIAQKLLSSIGAQQLPTWALVSLAQCAWLQNDLLACKKWTEQLLASAPEQVDGNDMAASIACYNQQWQQAFDHLDTALKISPRGSRRQRAFAALAMHLNKPEQRLKAINRIFQLASTGGELFADDYLARIDAQLSLASVTEGRRRQHLIEEAKQEIKTARRQYPTLLACQAGLDLLVLAYHQLNGSGPDGSERDEKLARLKPIASRSGLTSRLASFRLISNTTVDVNVLAQDGSPTLPWIAADYQLGKALLDKGQASEALPLLLNAYNEQPLQGRTVAAFLAAVAKLGNADTVQDSLDRALAQLKNVRMTASDAELLSQVLPRCTELRSK